MEFRYSTEQDDFRKSLQRVSLRRRPLAGVREVAGHDPQLWQRLCSELELPGMHIPLEYGGAGGTLVESAIVFSELGRALTPVPLAATTFAIEAVFRTGDEEQRRRLLKGMLCGDRSEPSRLQAPTTPTLRWRVCERTGRAERFSPARAGPFCTVTSRTCSSCPRSPTVWSRSTLWRPTPPG